MGGRASMEIGIPTISGREHILITCLAALLGTLEQPVRLHICSTSGTLKVGSRNDGCFVNRYLRTLETMGWEVVISHDDQARGPNHAVQTLLDGCRSDWLLRVDDDVIVGPCAISKLRETVSPETGFQEKIGAVAAPVNGFGVDFVDYHDYWSEQNRINSPHLVGLGRVEYGNDNFVHHSGHPGRPVWAEVDFLSGYCLLISVEAAREVGGYRDCPHHHKEDWSFTLKMRSAGYRLLIRGDAIAWHHHYQRDMSDEYRSARSREDHRIWDELRKRYPLDPKRHVGIVER